MPTVSHQTARLSKGKHQDPQHGVCVMELTSMLAGEPFTDRPRSACPVIAGFLRTYNDLVGHDRRQDLYRFAAAAVGTKGSREVQEERARRCVHWTRMLQRQQGPRGLWRWARGVAPDPQLGPEAAGVMAAQLAAVRRRSATAAATHVLALGFVEELIAVGRESEAIAPDPAPVHGILVPS